MKNMICLQKNDEGQIECWELSQKGVDHVSSEEGEKDREMWNDGGTVTLDEIDEILDKERQPTDEEE